jgi:hypothetical protein
MGLVGGDVNQGLHFRAGEFSPVARDVVVFLDDLHRMIDAVLLAFNAQPVVVEVRANVQGVFEQTHVFIQRAKEGFNLSGDVNGTSHSDGERSRRGNDLADNKFLVERTYNTLTQQTATVKLQQD